jgi:hypothetical protein
MAEGDRPPTKVLPPPSPRKYWTRRGIAEWLVEKLAEDVPTLVGIDHGFSFPLLPPDWRRRFTGRLAKKIPARIICAYKKDMPKKSQG